MMLSFSFGRGLGGCFELAKIFFRKGSSFMTLDYYLLSVLVLRGMLMIKSSSSSS